MNQFKSQTKYNKPNLNINNSNCHFIKCPLYGEINFYQYQLWIYELINTPHFQRLNYIKQLNFCSDHFPGATHTRLSHSLGTYEITRNFIKELQSNNYLTSSKETSTIIDIALATSLLHDIGHHPHSHGFEIYFNYSHENTAISILKNPTTKLHQLLTNRSLSVGYPKDYYINQISSLITGKNNDPKFTWVQNLISAPLDVDRLDFLSRDALFTGAVYFAIKPTLFAKWSLIINSDHLKNNTLSEQKKYHNRLAFFPKTQHSIYYVLFSRYLMYKEVYLNKHSLYKEKLIQLLLHHWHKILPNHLDLSKKYNHLYKYLLPFFKNKNFYSPELFINFTDETLNLIINTFQEYSDPLLSSYFSLYQHYESLSEHQFIEFTSFEYESFINKFPTLPKSDCTWIDVEVINFYNQNNPILIYCPQTNKVQQYSCNLSETAVDPKNKYAIISKKIIHTWKNK